jgi:hypothetical protein
LRVGIYKLRTFQHQAIHGCLSAGILGIVGGRVYKIRIHE